MNTPDHCLHLLTQQRMLPLYFHPSAEVSTEVLKHLYQAGIRAIEYTNRGQEALANFTAMVAYRDKHLPGLLLGIGTIKNADEAKAFLQARADFIICPGLIPEVAHATAVANRFWVPGCMTVTEIIQAEALGAKLVKLFPGNLLGPGFMGAIKDLFPNVSFMPTGGVELEKDNIANWFKAGVVAVGLGSKLISKELLDKQDYTQLTTLTRETLAIVQSLSHFTEKA